MNVEKIITFLVLVGFGMFAILNISNVNTAINGVATGIPTLVGGIARA